MGNESVLCPTGTDERWILELRISWKIYEVEIAAIRSKEICQGRQRRLYNLEKFSLVLIPSIIRGYLRHERTK